MANVLQLIGLILDLIGVVIMAYDIINIDKRIGTFDGLTYAEEIAKASRTIAKRGLFFIGMGFLFQCASSIVSMFHTM